MSDVDTCASLEATEHVMRLVHANKAILANPSSELARTVGHCSERWDRKVQLGVVLALAESKHGVALLR